MAKKAKGATKAGGGAHNLKMAFKLDPGKVAQIQRCIAKGQLMITVVKASASARATNGYNYD
jgi:hypothetical protein